MSHMDKLEALLRRSVLTEIVREALDECESCCLDDSADRERVERAIVDRLTEKYVETT